jgi:uncharacterized protein (DUF1330 family)
MKKAALLVTCAALLFGLPQGTLYAQGVNPAYVVVEVNIHDTDRFLNDYAAHLPATVEQYGGSYVVRGGPHETLLGEGPIGIVVVFRFDSVDAAKVWLASPEVRALAPVREETATTRSYLVEGVQ